MLDLASDSDPLTQWNESHGNRQAKNGLNFIMFRELQRGNPVINRLLLGHRGTGKSMMLMCAARLANWTTHIREDRHFYVQKSVPRIFVLP